MLGFVFYDLYFKVAAKVASVDSEAVAGKLYFSTKAEASR